MDAAAFDSAARDHFRWDADKYLHRTLFIGEREFLIPGQDFDNYLGTVEPIRVVQTLARRLEQALEYVARKGTAHGLDGELKHLADMDAGRQHEGFALVRIITWAVMPGNSLSASTSLSGCSST